LLKAGLRAEINVPVQKIKVVKSNAELFHCRQIYFGTHLNPVVLNTFLTSEAVRQCSFHIVGSEKDDLSREAQADNFNIETEKWDRDNFFQPALYRISSRGVAVIDVSSLTIRVVEMDVAEIEQIPSFSFSDGKVVFLVLHNFFRPISLVEMTC
jgi:hypothetical protein